MKTGIDLITIERKEQIEKHDRTIKKDILQNTEEQIIDAVSQLIIKPSITTICPQNWHPRLWSKMIKKPYKERLIIAGALLAAEIDRIQNQ